MKTPLSLRSTFTALTILVAVFVVVVSGALIALTTILQRTTASSAASVESVRLAEEAEIDLLLHERAEDALVRRDIEGHLQRRLVAARRFVTTGDEARMLGRASERVEAYMAAARDPARGAAERAAHQEGAYGALDQLVAINIAQSKSAQQNAARWSSLANILGIGVGTLFLAAAGVLLVWLRGRAFEPILGLAAAMKRFGRGDHDARAAEGGPQELREMCGCFNEMASALAAQRQAQMAVVSP